MSGIGTLIIAVCALCLFIAVVISLSNRYNLNNIKDKTVGHGQHGTARWATKKEINKMYKHIKFEPKKWRTDIDARPTEQGIVVGCEDRKWNSFLNALSEYKFKIENGINKFRPKNKKKKLYPPIKRPSTIAMVDDGDVHAIMIGAAGVGKTAYWLYPCIEYACATGMSFLSTDTKGDIVRNYGEIASKYYDYNVSVIDLRNPTRSNGNNLLHLVNKYMDLYQQHPDVLSYKAKAEKYAKIISKTIIMSGDDSASYGQNAYFYDSAEGLLTSAILLLAEFGGEGERHIVSVYKLIQELLEPSRAAKKNKFQTLVNELPEDHKAKWFAGAALTTSDTTMASVMSTALSRLNAFLDSELEQLLCFDTEIDAEKFCNEKSAIFVVMPEEDPNKFFMVSLIIQQLYREILAVADENNGKLKNRCVFYCDEFGTLPKIESAEMMFSASRSRRLQIVPIIQSFAQLEKNYGKEGADVIVDNTQLTIFGGFAPNSTSAETLSKALGSRIVMSGSVSRSKDNPSQSVQMIERPLMTADELKNLPKGTFVVMKTAKHPMKVKLKLFFMWGIQFEKPYMVSEQGNRKVIYVSQSDLVQRVKNKYKDYPTITERTVSDTKDDVFDNDIPSASVTSTPTSNKGITESHVYSAKKKEPLLITGGYIAIDRSEMHREPSEEYQDYYDMPNNTNFPIPIEKREQAKQNNALTQNKVYSGKPKKDKRKMTFYIATQEVEHGQDKV
jgi:type IV secretion system protein VirD4